MEKKLDRGLQYGYRSGLEEKFGEFLQKNKVVAEYEAHKIRYIRPGHVYTPDYWLPKQNVFIETKGRCVSEDRTKHLLVKNQHPEIKIKFVFQNSRAKLFKKSKTTYADWCIKHGFEYCDFKNLTVEWLNGTQKVEV